MEGVLLSQIVGIKLIVIVCNIAFSLSTTFQMHNFQNIIGHICIPDTFLLP